MWPMWKMDESIMDLEKFEKEELPRIKSIFSDDYVHEVGIEIDHLLLAFETAMTALRKEREQHSKISEAVKKLLKSIDEDEEGEGRYDVRFLWDLRKQYAEEIRRGG